MNKIDEDFVNACKDGDLVQVKYLLTSPELKENADIHAENDLGFRWACQNGHVELVKYLLTSLELKKHASIHTKDDEGFRNACYHGHLEVVKYLLTSPDLKEHADIHANNDEGFRNACSSGQIEVIKFLLYDLNLDISKELDKKLKEYLSDDKYLDVKLMINKRDLFLSLNRSLDTQIDNKNKAIKIKL